jgi:hypothetical protein
MKFTFSLNSTSFCSRQGGYYNISALLLGHFREEILGKWRRRWLIRCSHNVSGQDSSIGFPPCFVVHITMFSYIYIYIYSGIFFKKKKETKRKLYVSLSLDSSSK